MQRCVAPRRSSLSLSLLPPSSSHIPRTWRALRRCISHSTHARTSVEARAHAHRADRTQKPDVTVRSRAVNNFAQICVTVHTWLVASAPPNLQRCPCTRHPLCVLPCLCPPILGRSIGHRVRPVPHRPRGKCALCATTRRRVKGRRRRMRRPPCSLVRHACRELRRLMPTGWSCQVGASLLLVLQEENHDTVASREIEPTVFDPASVFLSTH